MGLRGRREVGPLRVARVLRCAVCVRDEPQLIPREALNGGNRHWRHIFEGADAELEMALMVGSNHHLDLNE